MDILFCIMFSYIHESVGQSCYNTRTRDANTHTHMFSACNHAYTYIHSLFKRILHDLRDYTFTQRLHSCHAYHTRTHSTYPVTHSHVCTCIQGSTFSIHMICMTSNVSNSFQCILSLYTYACTCHLCIHTYAHMQGDGHPVHKILFCTSIFSFVNLHIQMYKRRHRCANMHEERHAEHARNINVCISKLAHARTQTHIHTHTQRVTRIGSTKHFCA